MQFSHNTNHVLQDSPQSTTQILNQAHMHDVPNHLPSNPSSPLTLLVHVVGDVIQQPALVCPVHSRAASCLVCPPVCPLHYPLTLYQVYVMSSSQLICSHLVSNTTPHSLTQTSISLPLWQLLPIKQERDFYMNIYMLHVQMHSIMQWYYRYYMYASIKMDKMLSQKQGVQKSNIITNSTI